MTDLVPNYLSTDFNTLISRLREQIRDSGKFTDINYEGSNLNVLIELFAYVSELNTYYINKLAKNQFIDTADIYENVHRLSNLLGYNPKGYISSTGSVDITLSDASLSGKNLILDKWAQIETGNLKDADGNSIYFITTESQETSASGNTVEFTNIPVKQGKILKFNDENNNAFTYDDIIDNKIMMPLYDFDYDNSLTDASQSIRVFIDDEEWTRIDNFYDEISGLTNVNKVYRFLYDKYKQYYIEFSIYRDYPSEASNIEVWTITSLGSNGNVAANSITDYSTDGFITDSDGNVINLADLDSYTINNSSSTSGGADPEIISEIKENTKRTANAQFRNVTKSDYKTYLEYHSNVAKANVWGEQEENPEGGNVFDYNKVFISLIPSEDPSNWTSSLATTTYDMGNGTTIYIPVTSSNVQGYYADYVETISTYLEPRKMLCAYEEYRAPELIYFKFSVSVKTKSNYKYLNVVKDLKQKMSFYFSISERDFNENIEFTDLINNMVDTDYIDSENNNNFSNTAGISNFIIRDIKFWDVLNEQWTSPYDKDSENYPQFSNTTSSAWINELSNIQLGLNQFPLIDINSCDFEQI